MTAEFFLDTNVLIYAFTEQDARKKVRSSVLKIAQRFSAGTRVQYRFKSRRDERILKLNGTLSSLAGLLIPLGPVPSHKWLGYFQKTQGGSKAATKISFKKEEDYRE